jgi:hypothetical protein
VATKEFLHFGVFGTRMTTELEEGVIDVEARRVFKHGQCHSMALALHQETGWPIVGFKDEDDPQDSPGHCAVYCPQLDQYVDVEGVGAFDRYDERCLRVGRKAEIVPVPVETVDKLRDYLPIKAGDARSFAQAVVKQVIDTHGIAVLQNGGARGANHQSDSGAVQR